MTDIHDGPASAGAALKITDVVFRDYRWPMARPITNGLHTYTHHEITFVSVETDAGITGIGIGRPKPAERAFRTEFAARLIGRDPMMTEAIWRDLWSPKLYGRRGIETRALSSIDMALWDIKGKFAGLPIYKLLGGFRKDIPIYAAGGYYGKDKGLPELSAEMAHFVDLGARAVKMKVGAVEIAEDVARVRAVRAAIGPDIKLMIDANCAYRSNDAIALARRVEDQDIYWFEEPVQPDDYDGFRRIAAGTSMTLAAGENEYTRFGFRDLIATGAVAILQPDARYTGGVTEFMKIAALADTHGLDICPHGEQLAHLGLLAAIPNARMLEFYPRSKESQLDSIFLHTAPINADGTVTVPEAPGMALDPNEDFLATIERLA